MCCVNVYLDQLLVGLFYLITIKIINSQADVIEDLINGFEDEEGDRVSGRLNLGFLLYILNSKHELRTKFAGWLMLFAIFPNFSPHLK